MLTIFASFALDLRSNIKQRFIIIIIVHSLNHYTCNDSATEYFQSFHQKTMVPRKNKFIKRIRLCVKTFDENITVCVTFYKIRISKIVLP